MDRCDDVTDLPVTGMAAGSCTQIRPENPGRDTGLSLSANCSGDHCTEIIANQAITELHATCHVKENGFCQVDDGAHIIL